MTITTAAALDRDYDESPLDLERSARRVEFSDSHDWERRESPDGVVCYVSKIERPDTEQDSEPVTAESAADDESTPKTERARRVAKLTKALLRKDEAPARDDIVECMSCGYTYVHKPSKGRFCSDRCREWYDAGNPGFRQDWLKPRDVEDAPPSELRVIAGLPGVEIGSAHYADLFAARDPKFCRKQDGNTPMRRTRYGYAIHCAGCNKEFESRGLRCCSIECERRYRERQENLATMTAVGIEPAAKRKCEGCGGVIRKWRKGRRVSSATRFCSPKCQKKARDPR